MVTILMATYNGERYLEQQLESLLKQTVDVRIVITDDCSTDTTYDILMKYEKAYPDIIEINKRDTNSGNAAINFFEMMKKYKDDYIMLCDQDDVWKPDKAEKSLRKLKEMEAQYGKDMPLLVHSDLCVVDENLEVLDESYIHRVNADYSKHKLNNIIIQNTLTGATAMYNRALADMIIGEPKYMVMHDWWLILIASAFGEVDYIPEATIYYRQHGHNVVGSTNMRSAKYMLKRFFNKQDVIRAIEETYEQAESFMEVYGDKLSDKNKELVTQYCEIPKLTKFHRVYRIFKLNTLKNGFLRNVAYILFI